MTQMTSILMTCFMQLFFELSDGDMTIMMTEFESYYANVVND